MAFTDRPGTFRRWAALAPITVVALALLAPTMAAAAPVAPGVPAGPCTASGPPTNGATALEHLGADGLTAAAQRSGDTPDELRDRLLDDPTLSVDSCGRLFYADPAPVIPPDDPTDGDGAPPAAIAPFPYAQTFSLHSRPGANRVLYLDFTGITISGSNPWAQSYTGGAGWTAGAYDVDGNPATFSTAEQDIIQDTFMRVAEDYRPFGIDVTTADPGQAAIDRTSLADQQYGTRAVITDDTTIAAQCGCGGIAYIDVITRLWQGNFDLSTNDYQPAWIFSSNLTDSGHIIAQATSHEVGHNFGLEHDGGPGVNYYQGHGSWAPIMGVSYYRPISQWSKGEYPGANQTQDDLALIATGAPVVADDVGDTNATATVLPPGTNQTTTGVITTRADKDVFRFTASGATTISVTPAPFGPNLDIRADLSSSSGTPITFSDPASGTFNESTATGLNANISQTLAAGDYLLQVDGVGAGTLSTGYNDYGSLGAYTVTITTQTAPPTVPSAPAAPTAVAGDGQVQLSWTAPANGGSAIDRYYVTPIRAGVAQAPINTGNTNTTRTITGLDNGVSYTFKVRAHNAVGDGPDSPASTAVVPTATPLVPSAPAAPTAVAGDGQVQLSWSAPAANGSAIDRYYVTPIRAGVAQAPINTGNTNTTRTVTGLDNGVSYTFKVRAHNAVGDGPDSPASTAVVPGPAATRFVPLVPGRVLDSRPGGSNIGPFTTPWQPGTAGIRDVQIGGLAGVPLDAAAVVLNVTVVNPSAQSFLQLWPNGATQPQYGSSLNYNPGQIVPNAVTVKLGTGGKVRVFNAAGTTDVIIDVAGYYAATGGAGFTSLTPARVLDSRPGGSNIGPFATPWNPGTAGIRDVQIGGLGGVPADAEAVVLNVTVVSPSAQSFLQLWPTGATQPQYGSSLNFNPGQIVPNQVTVKLGTGGMVRVFNAVGTTHVIIDVSGYYKTGTGQAFYAVVPGRVLDSRPGGSNIGAFTTPWSPGTAGIRDVQVGGLAGVPAGADGVVMNVTVVDPTALSFLQLWPNGSTQPQYGSSLNFNPGQIVPNAVTVKLGTAGQVRVFNAQGTVHVIADVAGYFD